MGSPLLLRFAAIQRSFPKYNPLILVHAHNRLHKNDFKNVFELKCYAMDIHFDFLSNLGKESEQRLEKVCEKLESTFAMSNGVPADFFQKVLPSNLTCVLDKLREVSIYLY